MNTNKKTIEDISPAGKRVLVRCDFNVPIKNGVINDNKRIVEALPTIKYLISKDARVILCSHLGRPKAGEDNSKYSLAPIADELSKLLGQHVAFAKDVIGDDAKTKSAALENGEVLLIENVRFHKEEEKNDREYSQSLASLAELYVNDAFGTAHRAHSSTAGVTEFLPGVSGFLIKKELDIMGKALNDPKRPFVAILGGAKVSDKIELIDNLLDKVDALIIGGAMAYTFIKSQGGKIGKSLVEDDKLTVASEVLAKAKQKNVKLLLPTDNTVADDFSNEANRKTVPANEIPDGWQGLDIGPNSVKAFAEVIKTAGTVVWNGPMGVFEFENFASGTREVAKAVAESGAISIIGGGDSASAIEKLGYASKVTHISTGGGASLEFLQGLELPGIAALQDK
ncbi:phosphoglycerate kinase [Clostridia bacterium]|nr:phosphoglycerate kinase [Clostridia bacterium]